MRILITNDDGINAPGLAVLSAIAAELAGPKGEVWTVAPAFEQSGVGHATSHAHPTLIAELGPRRFAAEGSPADCVLAGIYDVMTDGRPDLVLSGVNRGNNSAENALYSGTLGAALQASLQGLPGIALSQYYGPGNARLDDPFEAAAHHGARVVRQILAADGAAGPGPAPGYRLFYNVNFPPCPTAEVKGTAAVPQGRRAEIRHSVEPYLSPSGRRYLWMRGGDQRAAATPGSDADMNLQGWISVTPMRGDFTAPDALAALKDTLA
jgi:5'-nucleotidase